MFDPDESQVDVELTEGQRPSSGAGDRLMVGLAAIALLGGALIVVGRFLPPPSEASEASPTPQPTVIASPTPQPTPRVVLATPLRTFRITEEPLPTVQSPDFGWSGWIRATQTIRIRSSPSTADVPIGVLHVGDAAMIEEQSPGLLVSTGDWVRVHAPREGWIRMRLGPHGNVRRFGAETVPAYAAIDSIAAGADGTFIASGNRWDDNSRFLVVSTDGREWQPVGGQGMLDGFGYQQVAYGPKGWLALVTTYSDQNHPTPWLWQSADGIAWRALGSLRDLRALDPYGFQLVGSPLGYVLAPPHSSFFDAPSAERVWYSADGEVWSERETPGAPGDIVAAGIGFYSFQPEQPGQPGRSGPDRPAAFSPDGWDWTPVDTSPLTGTPLGVAGAVDRLVALTRRPDGVQSWIATRDGDALTWRVDPAGASAFADAVVLSIQDGTAPIAMGYQRGTEKPLWWSNDLAGWHRHRLPASFGSWPMVGAATGTSYVIAGANESLLGSTPLMWSGSGTTELRPESRPVVPPVPDLTRSDCAGYSRDLLELMTGRQQVQVHCFGPAPVTLTAFALRCPDCVGEPEPGGPTESPDWLLQPDPDRYLHMSPVAIDDIGWFDGILAPGLDARTEWDEHWVRVTGHFDDPAAASCRIVVEPGMDGSYGSREQIVNTCRTQFVVTSVTLLPDR